MGFKQVETFHIIAHGILFSAVKVHVPFAELVKSSILDDTSKILFQAFGSFLLSPLTTFTYLLLMRPKRSKQLYSSGDIVGVESFTCYRLLVGF